MKLGIVQKVTKSWYASMVAGAITAPMLLATGSGVAHAATVPACPTSIQACGCRIKTAGTYDVVADLDASQGLTPNGDCLELKASRITLHLNGHKVTGANGIGTGIDLRKGSNYDTIDGGSPDASISGWNTGVEDSGRGDVLSSIDASSNALDGIEINHGNNDQLSSWNAADNGVFGAWIKQGTGNVLSQGTATSNGKAGIFVGCAAGGPSGEDCTGEGVSKTNDLHDDSADSNGAFGVALDSNSVDTTVDTVSASGNGTDDFLDSSCKGDSLSGDSFGSSSDSCASGSDS